MSAKKLMTEERYAEIPLLIARGLCAREIAEMFGVKPSTLAMRCCQRKISLRPLKPRPRGTYSKNSDRVRSHIQVKMDENIWTLFAARAHMARTTVSAVAGEILAIVARDNLYDAVIDK